MLQGICNHHQWPRETTSISTLDHVQNGKKKGHHIWTRDWRKCHSGENLLPERKKRNDGHLLFRWSHEKFAFECGTRAVCPTADGQAASNKQKGVCVCTYCVGKERHENSVSPGKVFFCVGSRGKCKCDSGTRQQRLVASPMFSVFL